MAHGYPVEILPRKEFELRLDISSMLKAYPDLFVSRRIDGVKEELIREFDGDYVLQDKVLEKIGVANFSVNLLGACYETDLHIRYRPVNEALTQLWRGEDVQQEIPEEMYERKDSCFAVYYNIADFLEFPMEQEITFIKEKDYIVFQTEAKANGAEEKYLGAFRKGEKMFFPVKKSVSHMPTCCNYWHVTFDTYSFEDPQTPINTSDKGAPIKRMLAFLRHNFLTMQGIIDVPEYDAISPYFYRKGIYNIIMRKIITCANMMTGCKR